MEKIGEEKIKKRSDLKKEENDKLSIKFHDYSSKLLKIATMEKIGEERIKKRSLKKKENNKLPIKFHDYSPKLLKIAIDPKIYFEC